MDNFNLEEAEANFKQKQKRQKPNPPIPPKKQTAKKSGGKKAAKKTAPVKAAKPKVLKETPELGRKPAKKRPDQRLGVEKNYFRHNSYTTFITAPQYKGNLTKEQILKKIEEFCEFRHKKMTQAIVCLEKHGKKDKLEGPRIELEIDPGVHFHALFKVDSKDPGWNTKNQFYFDEIFGQHVHVESAKDFNACILYCAKEGDFVTHNINVEQTKEAMKSKKGVKHIEVAQKIIDQPEIGLLELVTTYPGYMIQHQKKVIDFQTLNQNIRNQTLPFPGIGDYSDCKPEVQVIAKWLQENLPPNKRKPSQKQLYIYGPTCIGKTTLLMKLQEYFHTYIVPEEETFWSNFHDNYDLCIFDEFNGQKKITQLNSFVDGSNVVLTAKHVSAINKKKNIPVILCSNKSPSEVYHNVAEKNPSVMAAFIRRFEVVCCNNFVEGEDYLNIPFNNDFNLEKSDSQLMIPTIPEEDEKDEISTQMAQSRDNYINLDDSIEAFQDPFMNDLAGLEDSSSEESITIRTFNPKKKLYCNERLDSFEYSDHLHSQDSNEQRKKQRNK